MRMDAMNSRADLGRKVKPIQIPISMVPPIAQVLLSLLFVLFMLVVPLLVVSLMPAA